MKLQSRVRQMFRSPAFPLVAKGDKARDARLWGEAATAYAAALEIDPSLTPIWVQYGHALKESGDLAGAETAYRRALALDGTIADTHLQLGHLLKIAGRPSDAVTAYLASLELAPTQADALGELQGLLSQGVTIPADRLQAALAATSAAIDSAPDPTPQPAPLDALAAMLSDIARERLPEGFEPADISRALDLLQTLAKAEADGRNLTGAALESAYPFVFDTSDLIHHFRHSRLPTGIQRVQAAIVSNLLHEAGDQIRICCIFQGRWVEVPNRLFAQLVALSMTGGEVASAEWRTLTTRLELTIGAADRFRFPEGAYLINLGTSWFPDYLLHVRNAKQESGIRYIPFVHDLIPVVAPQFCLDDVTRNYTRWLLSVFETADLFLTNSHSTRRDLIDCAQRLGHTLRPEAAITVPLDASFTVPVAKPGAAEAFLGRHGLLRQPFVLFVSTIEPRKNHLALLDAWRKLIAERGAFATPKLVFVGGRGWMNDAVFARVAASEELQRQVLFLHGLSDQELAICYDACLFTAYPSRYEGWGLPVTESLCHGKVPLLARTSSLPEAGGDFAEYFDIDSPASLQAALTRLIDDAAFRREREVKIDAEFHARRWQDIGRQIADSVVTQFEAGAPGRSRKTGRMLAKTGYYYPLSPRSDLSLHADAVSGEPLRAGDAWHGLEEWGSWTATGAARIGWRMEAPPARARIYVGVKGLPGHHCTVELRSPAGRRTRARLAPSEVKWISLDFIGGDTDEFDVEITSDTHENLARSGDGHDTRVIGPGVLGAYLCDAADMADRMRFAEALATNMLMPGPLADDCGATLRPRSALAEAASFVSPPEIDEAAQPDTDASILVLQTCDPMVYYPMMEQSARTTRAYCARHGLAYQAFVGLKRGDLPWHATYNRIDMLSELLDHGFRGWVLHVDADAWIVDQAFDLRGYLANKARYAMIGAPSGDYIDHFWNMNIGVMLFNLGHPFMRRFIRDWVAFLSKYDLVADARHWNQEIPDDQGMFHQILDKHPDKANLVLHVDKGFFNSPWATFVRQAIRAENADMESRLLHMRSEIDAILKVDLPAA